MTLFAVAPGLDWLHELASAAFEQVTLEGVMALGVLAALVLVTVFLTETMGRFLDKHYDHALSHLAVRHGAGLHRQPGTRGGWFEIVGFGATLRISLRRRTNREMWASCQSAVLELPQHAVAFTAPVLFSNSTVRPCLLGKFEERFKLETDDLATFVALIPMEAQAEFVRLCGFLAHGDLRSDGRRITFKPGVDLTEEMPALIALFGGIAQRAEMLRRSHPQHA